VQPVFILLEQNSAKDILIEVGGMLLVFGVKQIYAFKNVFKRMKTVGGVFSI